MLDVAGRSPYRGLSSGELRDQRLEPLPIALAERRAGALAVIREDDEAIGSRRACTSSLMTSPIDNTVQRTKLYGLMKNQSRTWLRRSSRAGSSIVAAVR